MKLIKLTDSKMETQNNTVWGENVTHRKPKKEAPKLCSSDVFHAYATFNLALLMNPAHADITNLMPWDAEGKPVVSDGTKVGCFELTTIKELPLPNWYTDENTRKRVCVRFAILCAEALPQNGLSRKAIDAARAWLDNPCKQTADAAHAVAYTARAAAHAAATDAVAYAAADAAHTADYAADYAAADESETAAYATRAAVYAAYAAAYEADAAARAAARAAVYAVDTAAHVAAYAKPPINIAELADKAVAMEGDYET